MYGCPELCQCDSYETTSCQYADLTDLPTGIDVNVINLDLSFNKFEILPEGMKDFSELKYLNLSHNQISTLKFGDLEGLVNLEVLDLTYNLFHDWKDIHSSIFLPTTKLQYLDFSHNPLRTLSRHSNHLFIQSLEVLRLVNCSMKSIPVNVFNRLANLKELYLSDNPIVNISEKFQLQNTKLVEISDSRLHYLDENVFAGMPSLERLVLRKNLNLRSFACNSDSLMYLELANSMLEKVPSGYMRKVVYLDLSENYLKTIPARAFVNFVSLEVLNLSTNSLTSINDLAFEGLNLMTSLDLSYNKLSILGDRLLSNNSALIFLNLSHNYISKLDTINSKSLKVLIASFCEISSLERDSLYMMPSLVSLSLSRNYLTRLPDGLIAKSLVLLNLSNCRINTLNNETFSEMFYLREINLASNALTTIDPSYFPRAFKVTIKDNPWRCECKKLKRMFEWITAYSANDLNYLVCSSPEKVEGKTWEQACEDEWYPNRITKDTMWYYSLGIVIAMVLALFALVVLRKLKSLQEKRVREEEDARRAEEREALRRMHERQRESREEENRNAPDPRELQSPPSYNEALLLPRLDASHPSLSGSLHSLASRGSTSDIAKKNRIRRKKRRRKEEEERRASRITVDSNSSEEYQSNDNLSSLRRKAYQSPPLESDF